MWSTGYSAGVCLSPACTAVLCSLRGVSFVWGWGVVWKVGGGCGLVGHAVGVLREPALPLCVVGFVFLVGLLPVSCVGVGGGCWLLFENCTVDASIFELGSALFWVGSGSDRCWYVFCVCEVF
jgi:hypothetical protein